MLKRGDSGHGVTGPGYQIKTLQTDPYFPFTLQ